LIRGNSFGISMRLVAKVTALLLTPLVVVAVILVYVWEALEAYDD
jgi:succinate dehydrogenase hydrophobic anchor subunit